MENKYLPLGTLVSLKNQLKEIMIIGYFSIEYNNTVKMYDYIGCVYPEGLLLKNSLISFNHSDIQNIISLGYKSDKYMILNNNLNNQQNIEINDNLKSNDLFVNVKFDENGVVLYEELVDVKRAPEIIPKKEIKSIQQSVNRNEIDNKTPRVSSEFKFDENGVVIEDNTVKNNMADIAKNFKYQFDSNGVVIDEKTVELEEKSNIKYKFSEDGTVIGEIDMELPVKKNKQYKFSNDGTVIDEKEINNYVFDENGVVIGE